MATIRERTWTGADGIERKAWQADFRDQQGRRRHKQFSRKKDADAFMVAARGQVAAGTYSPDSTSITVAEAAELWLERCERDGLERSTMTGYRSHVRHHIGPLGPVKLSRLSGPMVEQFADDMLKSGRSRATARKVLGSLVSLIGEAQRRGLVAQNVAIGVNVKLAKRHKRKVEIPSKEEIKAQIDAVPWRFPTSLGPKRPLLITAVFTGLRASELRALRWQDVDFDRKLILVRQRADTSGRIGSLKSDSSRRDIPMSPMVVNALKEWKLPCPKSELDLVFPGRGGGVACHNTMRELLGPMHRYRHFFASWLIDQGFGPKRVQALMGHSSIQVTFDIYGHLFPQESDHDKFAAGELALVG
jgi:integrase